MANGDSDFEEVRSRVHEAVYGMLIEKISRDRYPSPTMMDLVEANLTERQYLDYVEALLDKVTDDQFPSMDMIRRLNSLV